MEKKKNSSISAVKVFVNPILASRFWMFFTVLFGIGLIIQPYLIAMASRESEKVAIVDAQGNIHLAVLSEYEEASALHKHIANLAVLALCSINPNGRDYEDLFKKLFFEKALEKANREFSETRKEIVSKKIYQKHQIFSIKFAKMKNGCVAAKIEGELLRVGTLGGEEFIDNIPLNLFLLLKRNQDIWENKRYPYLIQDYQWGNKKEAS